MVGCQWDVANERDERLKQKLLQIQSNLSTKADFGTEENGRSREVAVMVGWGVICFFFLVGVSGDISHWNYFYINLLPSTFGPKRLTNSMFNTKFDTFYSNL